MLLDSLVDREGDVAAGDHSLVGYHGSPEAIADRLQLIARTAACRAQAFAGDTSHLFVLAGMIGLYISAPEASLPDARPARDSLVETLGWLATPTIVVYNLRDAMRRVLPGRDERGRRVRGANWFR